MEQVETSLNIQSSTTTNSNSPEFEFSSFPQLPHLLSADQLFSDGFILPLHLLRLSPTPSAPEPPSTSSTCTFINTPRSWRYIFKKNSGSTTTTTAPNGHGCTKEKDAAVVKESKKREKNNGGVVGVGATELNINIWPFSRSRSAGNGGTRRVSSAPCSRSNSAGDFRGGLHLGRSSPVWQARRSVRKIPAASGSKGRVLNLNVYRNYLSSRNDENSVNAGLVEGVRTSNLFNIRTFFSKKDH